MLSEASGGIDPKEANPTPTKKILTPEQKVELIKRKRDYLAKFCELTDWLDQNNPTLQNKLQEYKGSELYKVGKDAELQVENAFKNLYNHKISFFNYFRRAPESMDLFKDKMDFVAMLGSGRVLGVQLMMLKEKDDPQQNQRLLEKKIEAVKYGIQEPKAFIGVREAIGERMKAQPELKVPYANMEFKMPRGVTWVNQEDVEEYPLLSEDEQTKSAAKIAAQFLGNLALDLNPETRAEIARNNHLKPIDDDQAEKLTSYTKNLVPLIAKVTN